MRYEPSSLGADVIDFVTERHLATLSLVIGADDLHVTPVGFTWDDDAGVARIITFAASKKTRLLESHGSLPAAVCQVDGGRWLALHGPATVTADPAICADAVRRYGERYRPPKDRGPDRRTIEIRVERILGRA